MHLAPDSRASTVFIVDDDAGTRDAISAVIAADGGTAKSFASGEAFLDAYRPRHGDCALIDAYLPGMSGIALLHSLRAAGLMLPAIMITGNSDVAMAVQAMKEGAIDFIEKPVAAHDLLASIHRALERSHDSDKALAWRESAAAHLADLTPRQRQIMDLVLATPARTSPPIWISANARSRITAPPSCARLARPRFRRWRDWRKAHLGAA